MLENNLLDTIEKRQQIKANIDGLQEALDALDAEIKSAMDTMKKDDYKIGGFHVFYKPQEKASFDTKSFGIDYPELKDKYTVKKTQIYYRITC